MATAYTTQPNSTPKLPISARVRLAALGALATVKCGRTRRRTGLGKAAEATAAATASGLCLVGRGAILGRGVGDAAAGGGPLLDEAGARPVTRAQLGHKVELAQPLVHVGRGVGGQAQERLTAQHTHTFMH